VRNWENILGEGVAEGMPPGNVSLLGNCLLTVSRVGVGVGLRRCA